MVTEENGCVVVPVEKAAYTVWEEDRNGWGRTSPEENSCWVNTWEGNQQCQFGNVLLPDYGDAPVEQDCTRGFEDSEEDTELLNALCSNEAEFIESDHFGPKPKKRGYPTLLEQDGARHFPSSLSSEKD